MSGHDGRRGICITSRSRRISALQQLGIEKTHIDVLCETTSAHQYWTELECQKRTDIVRYSFSTSQDPDV